MRTRKAHIHTYKDIYLSFIALILVVGIYVLLQKPAIHFFASRFDPTAPIVEQLQAEVKHEEYEEPGIIPDFKVIEIKSSGFSPSVTIVKRGVTVAFVNEDSTDHWAVADDFGQDKVGAFNSRILKPGEHVQAVMYGIPGTYTYHCGLHPAMKGTIIVQ